MPLYNPPKSQGNPIPAFHRLKAWTYEPAAASSGTSVPLSTGVIKLDKIPVDAPFLATSAILEVQTAGATLTAGQSLLGLYDSSGNRLCLTADQSAVWNSTGVKAAANFTTATVIQPGPLGFIYCAILCVGTTPAAFRHMTANTVINAGLSAGEFRSATILTGQTTLPTTLTLSGMAANTSMPNWVGIA